MRKIKEVLRLRFELKLDQRQIARSCSIAASTVHEYLRRAEAADSAGHYPMAGTTTVSRPRLFPLRTARRQPEKSPPDFAAIHEQLRTHQHLTLQLLWEEYRQANPEGYRYSRFCELYQRWRKKLDVVMRQEHKAGEKAFVDWAGSTIPDLRPQHRCHLASLAVRRRARRQFLHLGRSHTRPTDGSVVRALTCTPSSTGAASRRSSSPTTPRPA